MRRVWMLLAASITFGGCRQVFGIDEPLAAGTDSVMDAKLGDGHATVHDSPPSLAPGLAMYVEDGVALWTNDQPPDIAWALTSTQNAMAGVWTGDDATLGDLVFSGQIDGQHPFSVWMEGQVYAAQGTQQMQVTAGDYAFFDVEMIPNSGSFEHFVTCRNGMMQMRSMSVPIAGWYRVRVGWATQPTTAEFEVVHMGPNDPSFSHFNTTNLRH